MKYKNIGAKALGLGVVSVGLLSADVYAAALEEIVVTAQRRAQNQQDVPLSVTAVSGEALEAKGLSDVASIGGITPNVTLKSSASFGGSGSILVSYIRGIGQNDFAYNLEPGVGIYVDGVYLARNIGANADLLDIQNIEVLKGPQGTLFGRNSIGGALNIVTRDPGYEFAAKGDLTIGDDSRVDVRASVDIPLIENELTLGVSVSNKSRDGWQQRIPYTGDTGNNPIYLLASGGAFGGFPNTNTDDSQFFPVSDSGTQSESGDQDSQAVRAKLLWEPNERFSARLVGDYSEVDQGAAPFSLIRLDQAAYVAAYNTCISGDQNLIAGVAQLQGLPGLPNLCNSVRGNAASPTGVRPSLVDEAGQHLPYDERYIIRNEDGSINPDLSYAAGANFDKLESWGFNLAMDYELSDSMSLKSITAYRELEAVFGADIGGAPFLGLSPTFADTQEQFSQEIHLSGEAMGGRWNYLFGAYYFNEEGTHDDAVPFTAGLIQVWAPEAIYETEAVALFAHNNIELTDKLGLTIGARYTEEEKSLIGSQRDENAFATKLFGLPSIVYPNNDIYQLYPTGENTLEFDDFSYRVGFEYSFNDDVMAYASFATGYKGGGWTTRLTAPRFDQNFNPLGAPTFEPEEAETVEIGVKSDLFNGQARLNVALFSTDYSDIQLTFQDGTSPVTANGGDGTISGFEAELETAISDYWNLDASIGYLDTEYKNVREGVILTGSEDFVNTPEWTAHIGSSYVFETGVGIFTPRVDWMYQTETFNDEANTLELMTPSHDIVNASINFQLSEDSKWRLQAGVTNATDERVIVSGYTNAEAIYAATFNRPRAWYFTLRGEY